MSSRFVIVTYFDRYSLKHLTWRLRHPFSRKARKPALTDSEVAALASANGGAAGFQRRRCRASAPGIATRCWSRIRVPAQHEDERRESRDVGDGDRPALAQPAPGRARLGEHVADRDAAEDPNQSIEPPKPTA